VNAGTGAGQSFRIASHPAHTHASSPDCVFTLVDPVQTTLAAAGSSKVSIREDKYTGLVVAPGTTPMTAPVIGVTHSDLTAEYYGWVVVTGPASLLTSGTFVIGDVVVPSHGGGEAGACVPKPADGAATRVLQEIGTVMVVSANTEYSLIDLNLGL